MATINDVSKRAGVSLATVSRVINQPDLVRPQTREKVLKAVAELDYRPNLIARSLLSKRTFAVGVVISNFASPYYGSMLQGIVNELGMHDLGVLVSCSRETVEGERSAIAFLRDRQCDAIILHIDAMDDKDVVAEMRKSTPMVLMNRYLPDVADHCVFLDNVEGGRLAARYLIARGHHRIATVTGPLTYCEARDRLDGFREEFARQGLSLDNGLIAEGQFCRDWGNDSAIKTLIARRGDYSAIFCQNDDMAIGVIEGLHEAGIAVPTEVSVLGFDDMEFAQHMAPRLTTVRQPLVAIGRSAGGLAKFLLDGGSSFTLPRSFAPLVIERDSVITGPHPEHPFP